MWIYFGKENIKLIMKMRLWLKVSQDIYTVISKLVFDTTAENVFIQQMKERL